MADYISRKAAIEAFENADADVLEDYGDGACDWGFGMKNIQEVLNSVPAADVEPVRHGRWVYKPSTTTTLSTTNCSACGWWTQDFAVAGTYCFCPSCGSKMDLEGSDA